MDLMERFETTSASIIGREHLGNEIGLKGLPNQDSIALNHHKLFLIGVVSDGCGSTDNAQIGSSILANYLANSIATQIRTGYWDTINEFIYSSLHLSLVSLIKRTSFGIYQSNKNFCLLETIKDMIDTFAATLIGFVVTEDKTTIFSIGDGVYYLNGQRTQIGPFENNAPPYIVYSAIEGFRETHEEIIASKYSSFHETQPLCFEFSFHEELATEDVESLVVGSDGVMFLEEAQGELLPGRTDKVVPSIDEIISTDVFFRNPQTLQRLFGMMQANRTVVDWDNRKVRTENSLLIDDTSLIAIRRRKNG